MFGVVTPIAPHPRLFSQAARASRPEDPAPAPPPIAPWSQRELLAQQANRQRRYERWEQVRELFLKTGAPDQELARQLGIDHRTVKKFRTAEMYPEAKPRVRESIVDDHASYLDRRLEFVNDLVLDGLVRPSIWCAGRAEQLSSVSAEIAAFICQNPFRAVEATVV